MAFARVNQQSRSFPGRKEVHVDLNMFDLSHDVKTTFTMGKLVPILAMEGLPSDIWYIRNEVMLRFAPLYLPIMHRVNLSVDYFWIPNRIMWPLIQGLNGELTQRDGWEYFINPAAAEGNPTEHPYVEAIPYDATAGYSGVAYELVEYMGFPTALPGHVGAIATFDINAFLPAAYYMTWDQFYRNDQIQDRIFVQLESGNNTTNMPYEGTSLYLSCMYRNWNRDIFTSATPTPQIGAEVQIPLIDTDPIEFNYPTSWVKLADGTGSGAGDLVTTASSDTNVGPFPVGLDIQETAGSIAQLRYSLMLQEYLERSLRAGDRYSDFSLKFFGVDPFNGMIQQPQFLGSKRGKVVVSEVMSTAETATLKVGSYAGQALALDSLNDTIEYQCKEHGIILGIISVYPDSSYMQGIEKMWTRYLPQDYAWEQFALIGDAEIKNKEVNADIRNVPPDPDYNDAVFAYNRRYYEYIYKNDIYSGLMRTTLISFHLGRFLDNVDPENTVLDSDFITCRPDVTRVFQVAANEDEIYAHIYNDIKVRRRLPKFGIPAV